MKINPSNKLVKFVIVLAWCGLSIPAFAADEVIDKKHKIYAYVLAERLNFQGSLSYNKLLDYVIQDVGDVVELVPIPLRRGSQSFVQDKSSCVFPTAIYALRRVIKQKITDLPLAASSPIDYVSIRLYTRTTDPVISSKGQLKGKSVGHLLGASGTTFLDEDEASILLVPDESMLLKMLFLGRLNVVMGHHPDIPMAIERLGLGAVHYDPKMTVYRTPIHIVCHQFDGVEALLDKINFRIREARANGMAQKILGKYAEIVPLPEDARILKSLEKAPM